MHASNGAKQTSYGGSSVQYLDESTIVRVQEIERDNEIRVCTIASYDLERCLRSGNPKNARLKEPDFLPHRDSEWRGLDDIVASYSVSTLVPD
jgi:hypothetical protein